MDAFGPANIPHSPKHVPLLDKDVSSKVFTSLFPLAHITHGNEVTLINPNGVDLKQYEANLDKQISKYWDRLSRLAWSVIPDDRRSCLEEELECGRREGAESEEESEGKARVGTPSYKDHREKLREVLADCNWPRAREDFDLLEREIDLGSNFKKYLKALKHEAERSGSRSASWKGTQSDFYDYELSDKGNSQEDLLVMIIHVYPVDDAGGEVLGLYSPASNFSLLSVMKDKPPSTFPRGRAGPKIAWSSKTSGKLAIPCRKIRRGQRVVVRSEDDGFYYPGMAAQCSLHL
jgi:hypothetical protein